MNRSITPIDELRCEHGNMRRVLLLIADQLNRLDSELVPDFVLLANALYYMRKFPSQVHHPKEDLIFKKLAAADMGLKETIEKAHKQHTEIYELEDCLVELALNAPKPGTRSRAQLLELGRHYLEMQRQHSESEERVLFPRAAELLKAKDWTEVTRQFKDIDDPLFGRHAGERYELLFEHLMKIST